MRVVLGLPAGMPGDGRRASASAPRTWQKRLGSPSEPQPCNNLRQGAAELQRLLGDVVLGH
eukprot:14629489-Alexandrium_andersonii.AAC.1